LPQVTGPGSTLEIGSQHRGETGWRMAALLSSFLVRPTADFAHTKRSSVQPIRDGFVDWVDVARPPIQPSSPNVEPHRAPADPDRMSQTLGACRASRSRAILAVFPMGATRIAARRQCGRSDTRTPKLFSEIRQHGRERACYHPIPNRICVDIRTHGRSHAHVGPLANQCHVKRHERRNGDNREVI